MTVFDLILSIISADALSSVGFGGALLLGAVWVLLRCTSPPAARDGRRDTMLVLLLAGIVLAAAGRTLPLIYVGLFLVSAALHAAAVRQHAPVGRNSVWSSYLFHSACLLLVLLGLAVLSGLGTSIHVQEIEASARTAPIAPSALPHSAAVLSAVAVVAGLSGFAAIHALPRRAGGWLPHRMTPDSLLLLLAPSCAALLVLLRVVPVSLGSRTEAASTVIVLASWLLMLTGSVAALRQTRLVPLLATAGLFHFGLWLVGAAVGAWEASHAARSLPAASGLPGGCGAALCCFCADAVALLGLAASLTAIHRGQASVEFTEDVTGLARQQPLVAAAAAVCLCSLCGIPPFPGFWARWWLLMAVFSPQQPSSLTGLYEPHYGFIATCAVLLAASACMAAVWLRLLQRIVLDEPRGRLQSVGAARWAAGLVTVLIVAWGLWPQPLLHFAIRAFPPQFRPAPPPVEIEHPESDGDPDVIPGPFPSA